MTITGGFRPPHRSSEVFFEHNTDEGNAADITFPQDVVAISRSVDIDDVSGYLARTQAAVDAIVRAYNSVREELDQAVGAARGK